MPRYRCNSCQGEYSDRLADGMRYFHACVPVKNPDYQPSPGQPKFDQREMLERADKRDENVVQDDTAVKTTAKAEGAGRTKI